MDYYSSDINSTKAPYKKNTKKSFNTPKNKLEGNKSTSKSFYPPKKIEQEGYASKSISLQNLDNYPSSFQKMNAPKAPVNKSSKDYQIKKDNFEFNSQQNYKNYEKSEVNDRVKNAYASKCNSLQNLDNHRSSDQKIVAPKTTNKNPKDYHGKKPNSGFNSYQNDNNYENFGVKDRETAYASKSTSLQNMYNNNSSSLQKTTNADFNSNQNYKNCEKYEFKGSNQKMKTFDQGFNKNKNIGFSNEKVFHLTQNQLDDLILQKSDFPNFLKSFKNLAPFSRRLEMTQNLNKYIIQFFQVLEILIKNDTEETIELLKDCSDSKSFRSSIIDELKFYEGMSMNDGHFEAVLRFLGLIHDVFYYIIRHSREMIYR